MIARQTNSPKELEFPISLRLLGVSNREPNKSCDVPQAEAFPNTPKILFLLLPIDFRKTPGVPQVAVNSDMVQPPPTSLASVAHFFMALFCFCQTDLLLVS